MARNSIKTISFAATHFTVAFGVAYALTGDVVVGGAVALVEPAVNTVAYYFHEKIWSRIGQRNGRRDGQHHGQHHSPPGTFAALH